MRSLDPAGLRLVELHEYGSTTRAVPLSPSCAATIAGQLGLYLAIARDWTQPDHYHLTAKQYVGDIVVGDVHIRIRSAKASTANLFWMLTHADSDPAFREALQDYAEDEGLFEYLVTVFARRVERLARGGLHRAYRTTQGTLPRMRGRLDVPRQIRQATVHPERFALRWSEHDVDTLENRLLRGVLQRLALVRYPSGRMLGHRLRRIQRSFDLVGYAAPTEHDFASVRLSRMTARYKLPLALGHLLWRHHHVRNEGGAVPFQTFLIDLNDLFERFIAACLRDRLQGSGITVEHQHRIHLDANGLEAAEIDVVLLHRGHPVLALDTKYKHYKGRPKREDLNQMFAYCHALRVPRGILLYPHGHPLREARHLQGATIEAWGIDLGESVEVLEERLGCLADELAATVAR